MSEKKTKKKGLVGLIAVVAVIAVLIGSTFNLIKSNLNLGLDLQGGFEILYQVSPLNEGETVDMTSVVNSIEKRVNVLGVSEPSISVEGSDRIRVQLAGVADPESARKMIGTTANLTFRDADDNLLADSSIVTEGGASLSYQDGKPIVSLKIADTTKWAEITKTQSEQSSGSNIIVIWLDYQDGDSYQAEAQKAANGEEPKYVSAASVSSQITGDCIISGNFTESEAKTIASLINSGSLPVQLTEISSNVVSAAYGADALQKTALAGIIGILLIIAFMIYQYRAEGVIAGVMLCAYIWAVFGIYAMMGAVFTLSGIAALVLGVGMTVDANIITYERIRQEMYKGRSIRSAVAEGQKISFSAIFDAQFTTLIAGLIMYWWGNGSVKGFATMLIITVLMTLALNVGLSRWILNLFVETGIADKHPQWFGVKPDQIPDVQKGQKQFYFGGKQFDFLKGTSVLVKCALTIIAGACVIGIIFSVQGQGFMNLGIDFSSGTKITVTSDSAITVNDVKAEMESLGYTTFTYQTAGDTTVYATTKDSLSTDDLSTIKSAFKEKYGQEPGDNVVTPVVGRELVRNAIILTLVAWVAMLAYVAFRYEWDYSISCLVALIHDVLITLCAFAILRLEVNTELISVLLTIIGYSINNSIVVFDRVRELIKEHGGHINKTEYRGIVNDALNKNFRMSLFSSISTIIPVICLILLGSNAIFTFTFAMLIGLVAGTLSSLFLAPGLFVWIRTHHEPKKKKQKAKKKEQLDEYTIKGINA